MGTIHKSYADKPLVDLNLGNRKIRNPTYKLIKHPIRHASTLIKTRCVMQYNVVTTVKGQLGLRATNNPPDPHYCLFYCSCGGRLPDAGTYIIPSLILDVSTLPAESFLLHKCR